MKTHTTFFFSMSLPCISFSLPCLLLTLPHLSINVSLLSYCWHCCGILVWTFPPPPSTSLRHRQHSTCTFITLHGTNISCHAYMFCAFCCSQQHETNHAHRQALCCSWLPWSHRRLSFSSLTTSLLPLAQGHSPSLQHATSHPPMLNCTSLRL